ncbi:MAG TPA: hypothetical protein PK402_04710 [Tepidisphaeraceae bacterium]|nr:hypothetical protein [Tepidisphaeraceae bacterium]
MPQFGHQDGFDVVALITGPSHVCLGIRFGDGHFELIKRQRVSECHHGALDEVQIVKAIQAGIALANSETGEALKAEAAFYIEDDSPRYDLFTRCAYLLASRRTRIVK